MYLFIAIIFIAELIIATSIICSIVKVDKKILVFNTQVTESRPKIKQTMVNIKENVNKSVKVVQNLCEFVEKQRNRYMITIIKSSIILLLFVIFRKKRKKYPRAIRIAMSLINLL